MRSISQHSHSRAKNNAEIFGEFVPKASSPKVAFMKYVLQNGETSYPETCYNFIEQNPRSYGTGHFCFTHNLTSSQKYAYQNSHSLFFTSTGKERDEETGYSYFGARYMDHEVLTSFLSIDRYASKYPSITPYAYCSWNLLRHTDPTGDTIFNAYEKYKDVTESIQQLTKSLESAKGSEKRRIQRKINFLNEQKKYYKVQGALDAFKEANLEEYNILDSKLKSYGGVVNITVSVSDDYLSENNSEGETHINMLRMFDTESIVGVSSITITLYGLAFCQGDIGLSTLANEFGDALFSVVRFQEQYGRQFFPKVPS